MFRIVDNEGRRWMAVVVGDTIGIRSHFPPLERPLVGLKVDSCLIRQRNLCRAVKPELVLDHLITRKLDLVIDGIVPRKGILEVDQTKRAASPSDGTSDEKEGSLGG